MMLEVPFKFEIGGLKEGGRQHSRSSRWDVATVELPFASDDEAPVVVSWFDGDMLARAPDKVRTDIAADGMQHVRLYEGRYWKPFIAQAIWAIDGNPQFSFADFESLVRTGYCTAQLSVPRDVKSLAGDPFHGFSSVSFTDRAQKIRTIEKVAAQFLVVDGMMYALAVEPRIVVRFSTRYINDRGYPGHLLDIVTDPDLVLDGATALFPVDRFNEAVSYAKRKNAHLLRKEAFNEANRNRCPTISYPDGVEIPDSLPSLIETHARSAAVTLEKVGFGSMNTATVREYANLRDGIELLPADEGIDMIEDAANRMISLHENRASSDSTNAWLHLLRNIVDLAGSRPIRGHLPLETTAATLR